MRMACAIDVSSTMGIIDIVPFHSISKNTPKSIRISFAKHLKNPFW